MGEEGGRVRLAHLDLQRRTLLGRRRGRLASLGRALLENEVDAPTPAVDEEFALVRDLRAQIDGLHAEEQSLAEASGQSTRSTRVAVSLMQAKGKGEGYVKLMHLEGKLKKLRTDRDAILARIGGGLRDCRSQVVDAEVLSWLAHADRIRTAMSESRGESEALRAASKSVDPGMRRRFLIVVGIVGFLLFVLSWYIVWKVVF